MDYAKNLMKKYGWKEGEGLGKNNTGINKALKANLKFDTAGLGVDPAADFNNHWWERVFNEAANNIDVKSDGDKISMKVKDENCVEISTKEYSVKKLKKAKGNNESYNNFLKSATLTNLGNEESDPNQVNVEDIKLTVYKPLTDEELFAACGGRTAHKGARHGLQLTGKLSRIEAQEKLLLAKLQNNLIKEENNDWTLVKDKKSKKVKKSKNGTFVQNPDESENLLNEISYNTEYHIKSKKKKKRQKEVENNLTESLDLVAIEKPKENVEILGLNEKSKTIKKEKKKIKKGKSVDNEEWCKYRTTIIVDELEEIQNGEYNEKDKDIPKNRNLDTEHDNLLSPVKSNKKIKKKQKSESKKYAKKLKRTLENITESLDNSMDIDADN